MDKELEAQLDEILKGEGVEKKLGTEPWDIPVGQAIMGGFMAIFASELIDGILSPNYRKWWFRLVLRIVRRLPKRISDRLLARLSNSSLRALAKLALASQYQDDPRLFGAKTMALFLAYDAIKDLTPLDEWAKKGAI